MRGGDDNELKMGEFDEIDSHNSFLEALNAWRGATPTPVKPTSTKITVVTSKANR